MLRRSRPRASGLVRAVLAALLTVAVVGCAVGDDGTHPDGAPSDGRHVGMDGACSPCPTGMTAGPGCSCTTGMDGGGLDAAMDSGGPCTIEAGNFCSRGYFFSPAACGCVRDDDSGVCTLGYMPLVCTSDADCTPYHSSCAPMGMCACPDSGSPMSDAASPEAGDITCPPCPFGMMPGPDCTCGAPDAGGASPGACAGVACPAGSICVQRDTFTSSGTMEITHMCSMITPGDSCGIIPSCSCAATLCPGCGCSGATTTEIDCICRGM